MLLRSKQSLLLRSVRSTSSYRVVALITSTETGMSMQSMLLRSAHPTSYCRAAITILIQTSMGIAEVGDDLKQAVQRHITSHRTWSVGSLLPLFVVRLNDVKISATSMATAYTANICWGPSYAGGEACVH